MDIGCDRESVSGASWVPFWRCILCSRFWWYDIPLDGVRGKRMWPIILRVGLNDLIDVDALRLTDRIRQSPRK